MTEPSLFEDTLTVAQVALPIAVDQLFDYTIPEALADDARVGCRVRVGFRRQQRNGIIVARGAALKTPRTPGRRLHAIKAVLDDEPVLGAALLEALRAEAKDVLCPIGIALHAALPPDSVPHLHLAYELTTEGRRELETRSGGDESLRDVLRALEAGPRTRAELRRKPDTDIRKLPALEARGWLRRMQVARIAPRRAAVQRIVHLADGVDVNAACALELKRAPRQAALLADLAARGATPHPELVKGQPGADAALRELVARGFVRIEQRPIAIETALPDERPPPELTAEQRKACAALSEAVRTRSRESFLLQGVTGSGKTEVYLRAVATALEAGRQAIVLVPEITLTHQILGRLRGRFGDRLAVLHSGLKPAARLAEWDRLRRGETLIAVGARSALFAPTRDLGVIVMDEEHDGAYKNEEGFRYHARRLARRRSVVDGCPLILGSATPSLELRHAAEKGRVRHLRLEHRIGSQPLPAVSIVDLTEQRAGLPRGRKLILSGPLLRALRETLADGAQAILFLNRRGFSTQIACFDCGHVCRCAHCDIALTYHVTTELLLCHYCDFKMPPPKHCPQCEAPDAALLGIGTERVEEEVRATFPDARLARLDRDTASRRGFSESVLQKLRDGEIDVLIGTQMVAKGHDFPGVRLVGIVNGDLGLHLPDFRAAERCFQLLTQVAGRAGRANNPGRVVLQAWSPGHYAIRPVATHDYETFYREESQQRAALGYPPHGHLGLVRVSSTVEASARDAARHLAECAQAAQVGGGGGGGGGESSAEVLGPAKAPIAKLRGRYRFQFLLRQQSARAVREVLQQVSKAAAKLPAALRVSIDTNPYDML